VALLPRLAFMGELSSPRPLPCEQEAEGYMVKMAAHIQTLEEEVRAMKTNDAYTQRELNDKLQLAVHEKRKAVKHCERILDESRDVVHKRGGLIKQLDEEARARIQVRRSLTILCEAPPLTGARLCVRGR
jgi:hypothetical protein